MSAWPQLKTARQLLEAEIIPEEVGEQTILRLARSHMIGRKMGRAVVFTPADVAQLVEKLPCPSSSSPGRHGSPNYYISGAVRGISVDESTGTSDPGAADAIRILREAEILKRSVHGDTATRTFAQAP
jgi:hypothetical protein